MTKQVIVMRKDLNMRKGKMIAQGAHASMKVFFDRILEPKDLDWTTEVAMKLTPDMIEWMSRSFTKICVSVNSEEELLSIMSYAAGLKIPCALIKDNGKTEFGGVPTYTCCAIGPAQEEDIDKVTGGLPLL